MVCYLKHSTLHTLLYSQELLKSGKSYFTKHIMTVLICIKTSFAECFSMSASVSHSFYRDPELLLQCTVFVNSA
jgi:hypothetical protein